MGTRVIKTNELKSVMSCLVFSLVENCNIRNDRTVSYHHSAANLLTLKYQKRMWRHLDL